MTNTLVLRGSTTGGQLHIIETSPVDPKTEIPILVAPGYGETHTMLRGVIETLVARNRRVVTLDQPRHGGLSAVPVDCRAGCEGHYPKAAYQRSLNLLGTVAAIGAQKVDVIAHSQGCLDTVIAASMQSDMFRNLVLVNPAGTIGQDTFPQLLRRFTKEGSHTALRQICAVGRYIMSNPYRAATEGIGIATGHINTTLPTLRGQGIGIVMIGGVNDTLFPMDRIQSTLPKDAASLDGFLAVKGGHSDFLNMPELYAGAAESMLTALESRPIMADLAAL